MAAPWQGHARQRHPLATNAALGKRYAAADMGELLADAGAQQAAHVWESVKGLTMAGGDWPPGVPVVCFQGYDVPTPVAFAAQDSKFSVINVAYGQGDGTVVAAALEVCAGWAEKQAQNVAVWRYRGVEHAGILSDDAAFLDVVRAIVETAAGLVKRAAASAVL